MCFELLESLERMNIGVGVVEAYHIAHCHQVVFCQVVAKAPAVRFDVLKEKTKQNYYPAL